MNHLKLMKLLYLAEREALIRLGRPILFDYCVSMEHGPVLSQTLNLMHGESDSDGHWDKAISRPVNYEVSLVDDPGNDKLSEAEDQLIQEIFALHGTKTRWQIRDFTHTLEEWQDPKHSSIKIDYEDILRAGGKTDSEIEAILEDIEALADMDMFIG